MSRFVPRFVPLAVSRIALKAFVRRACAVSLAVSLAVPLAVPLTVSRVRPPGLLRVRGGRGRVCAAAGGGSVRRRVCSRADGLGRGCGAVVCAGPAGAKAGGGAVAGGGCRFGPGCRLLRIPAAGGGGLPWPDAST